MSGSKCILPLTDAHKLLHCFAILTIYGITYLPLRTIWRFYNYELWWKRHKNERKSFWTHLLPSSRRSSAFFIVKLLLVCAIAVVIGGSCLVFGAAQGIIQSAPDISSINVSPEALPQRYTIMKETKIQTLAKTGANRIYVSLDQIPVELQHAFVAIEDERFYKHNGIDLRVLWELQWLLYQTEKCHKVQVLSHSSLLKKQRFSTLINESTMEKIKAQGTGTISCYKAETVMSKDKNSWKLP